MNAAMDLDQTNFFEYPKLTRRLRLQYEPAQESWVLLYPEGMVQLNASAAEILRRCDGGHTVPSIVQELEKLFNIQGIAAQVQALIDEGTHRGWIE